VRQLCVEMCHITSRPFPDGPIHAKTGKQWLDIKVFCMRLNASGFSKSVQIPESLTLHFLPRSNAVALEINERRFHPSSSAFLALQRNRVEEKSEGEIIYVGMDTIRTSDDLCFEVYLRDEPLIFGTLEKRQDLSEDLMPKTTWTVDCSSRLEYSSKWSLDAMSIPTVDVYVAGRISGSPIILTQTLQLLPRRKRVRHCTLDVIPEGNETAESCSDLSDTEPEYDDSESSFAESNSSCDCDFDWESRMEEREKQEDSWIDSGLRLGIGFGLGLCLGVGLLVSSFQGTSRTLRKQFLYR